MVPIPSKTTGSPSVFSTAAGKLAVRVEVLLHIGGIEKLPPAAFRMPVVNLVQHHALGQQLA